MSERDAFHRLHPRTPVESEVLSFVTEAWQSPNDVRAKMIEAGLDRSVQTIREKLMLLTDEGLVVRHAGTDRRIPVYRLAP